MLSWLKLSSSNTSREDGHLHHAFMYTSFPLEVGLKFYLMRILNKIAYNVHLYVCYSITVTDLNKGKCIHIILQKENRIVSYEALVFEMKVILHLKEIMKTKSLEVGSMQYSCKWVKEFRISSEHQKNTGQLGNHKNSLHDRKFVCSVPYTC